MQITSKSGRVFELPTDEEEAAIQLAIASDPNTYELADKEFAELRPIARLSPTEKITIRLSREVTEYFRATGTDWQTKIDNVLLEYIAAHP